MKVEFRDLLLHTKTIVMSRYEHKGPVQLLIVLCGLLLFQSTNGQLREKNFYEMIDIRAWSAKELTALEQGEVVVRSLETDKKQEISSISFVRMKDLPLISMKEFRASFKQKGGSAMKAGGRFSDPATVEDLQDLELDKDSVERLRKCAIGACDLNLSAEMIRRFQQEIDWNSPNAGSRATMLMKEILLTYERQYQAWGNVALGRYENRRKAVDLAASHSLLLSNSSLVHTLAPEFVGYLQKFPEAKLENVESSMHWSVVDFGLKPSITLSHAVAYPQVNNEGIPDQLFVASKQIYSSRYLDASLTFTLLLRVDTGSGMDTYIVFIDRSHSDALEGRLGSFARGLVQKESAERIKTLLNKAQLRLLSSEAENKRKSTLGENGDASKDTVFRQRNILLILGGVVALLVLVAVYGRRRLL